MKVSFILLKAENICLPVAPLQLSFQQFDPVEQLSSCYHSSSEKKTTNLCNCVFVSACTPTASQPVNFLLVQEAIYLSTSDPRGALKCQLWRAASDRGTGEKEEEEESETGEK